MKLKGTESLDFIGKIIHYLRIGKTPISEVRRKLSDVKKLEEKARNTLSGARNKNIYTRTNNVNTSKDKSRLILLHIITGGLITVH